MENIEVSEESSGMRLDVFLARKLSIARNQVQRLVTEGRVSIKNSCPRVKDKVKKGDIITIEIPPPQKLDVVPENIPLPILFQDSWIAVINKPRGIAVHPGGGKYDGTLVNALIYHIRDLSGVGGIERPGIVHRLDKDTSGVMVIAKNDKAHENLSRQFKTRTIRKEYIALVHGILKRDSGYINAPIGRHPVKRKKMTISQAGREARTRWTVLERFENFSLLFVQTFTGRTHQIRVHMTSIGFPLVGDEVYGHRKNSFDIRGHVLHARLLGLHHPEDERYMEFTAPLPEEIESLIEILRRNKVQ